MSSKLIKTEAKDGCASDRYVGRNSITASLTKMMKGCVEDVSVCRPVVIVKVDRKSRILTVRPLCKTPYRSSSGKLKYIDGDEIEVRPVVMMSSGIVVDWPYYVGDTGWVVSTDYATRGQFEKFKKFLNRTKAVWDYDSELDVNENNPDQIVREVTGVDDSKDEQNDSKKNKEDSNILGIDEETVKKDFSAESDIGHVPYVGFFIPHNRSEMTVQKEKDDIYSENVPGITDTGISCSGIYIGSSIGDNYKNRNTCHIYLENGRKMLDTVTDSKVVLASSTPKAKSNLVLTDKKFILANSNLEEGNSGKESKKEFKKNVEWSVKFYNRDNDYKVTDNFGDLSLTIGKGGKFEFNVNDLENGSFSLNLNDKTKASFSDSSFSFSNKNESGNVTFTTSPGESALKIGSYLMQMDVDKITQKARGYEVKLTNDGIEMNINGDFEANPGESIYPTSGLLQADQIVINAQNILLSASNRISLYTTMDKYVTTFECPGKCDHCDICEGKEK